MSTIEDRLKGCFFGLAIGDALGVPLEFHNRDELPLVTEMIGQGPFMLKPGEWTDDTSMALCIADSLIYKEEFDATDIMDNFVRWWQTGFMSHNGRCFDIGGTTKLSLLNYMDSDDKHPYQGSVHERASGNGGIMRLAPIPIFYHNDLNKTIEFCKKQTELTHASDHCVTISITMGAMLFRLFEDPKNINLIDIEYYKSRPRDKIKSTGYVMDTWHAALWAVCNTSSFEEALILAVNLADDSDTVGAVTGQIAGALYGYSNIPERWLEKLVWKDKLEIIYNDLITKSPK